MYYVKWHDYDDDDENTWEPEDLLLKMNARDQIDKFNSENVRIAYLQCQEICSWHSHANENIFRLCSK